MQKCFVTCVGSIEKLMYDLSICKCTITTKELFKMAVSMYLTYKLDEDVSFSIVEKNVVTYVAYTLTNMQPVVLSQDCTMHRLKLCGDRGEKTLILVERKDISQHYLYDEDNQSEVYHLDQ